MDKKRVCVVGATGSVGQEFIQSLNNHPWFELTQISASPKSAGKNYLDAIKNADGIVQWEVDGDIPSYVKNMIVKNVDDIDTLDKLLTNRACCFLTNRACCTHYTYSFFIHGISSQIV